MPDLSAYLPQDRLSSLAQGASMPDRTSGTALFADISGFTSLTETLTRLHGQRRGIEEVIRQINAVYGALICEIERFGGSVISFAGDSMTCWFDQATTETAASNAVSAGLAMQAAMDAFPQLGLKIAVTSGPARRFAVGDPSIQRLDALAGVTVARLATGEQLAGHGETLLDVNTVEALGATLSIHKWRKAETGERFALVAQFSGTVQPDTTAPIPEVDSERLRPWVHPAIYARQQAGHGLFLSELRPVVALFLSFTGIDYDGDPQAIEKLDELICQVQAVLFRCEGLLIDLTIGDKGSYLYAAFGALLVHEDDTRRAVQAALELRRVCAGLGFLAPVQIGISQGVMLCGAYGGPTRRTYGVLGDDVNLAARLMTNAEPGEILLSSRVHKQISDLFNFEPRPPLEFKGKAEPLPVFAVTDQYKQRAIRLEEPRYALPMMGRQAELAVIEAKLDLALQGHGQVIGVIAEAGMGKSRLVTEAIRLARKKGFTGYGGACEASGINTPYLVWKPIWQAFFDIDPGAPLRRQLRNLEGEIEDRAPERLEAIPVLSVLLDVPIEENEFTRGLEPKDRRNVLSALLEDCLKSAASEDPLLFVLEDLHWLDALSHELLETLARVSATLPVCFVLAYRPPDQARLQTERVESLEHYTRITLNHLNADEAEGLIRAKLAQLFPERSGALPPALIDELTLRAEGNPFYIEELLNYLRDRGITPYDAIALKSLDLPDSLHALILSRMDRLSEAQQIALKSASIIGRSFRLSWLHGYYPALGTAERIKADLEELAKLDLTPLDTPEPELAYLFKHIITLEVAYESLPYATRSLLHERLAQYIENLEAERFLDLLAFHYGLSTNADKQREYFRKAGQAAQDSFANEAALAYYKRLLPLLPPVEQIPILAQCGAVNERMGQYVDAEDALLTVLDLAEQVGVPAAAASAQLALGKLSHKCSEFQTALDWLAKAQAGWAALDNPAGLVEVLIEMSVVYRQKGDYKLASQQLQTALAEVQHSGDRHTMARIFLESGVIAFYQGDYAAAQKWGEQSLELYQEIGDQQGISGAINNLGNIANEQGAFAAARALFEQSLVLKREIGDKPGIAHALNNLGGTAFSQGDYAGAQALFQQSLVLQREIDDKTGIATALGNLGNVAYVQGDYATAWTLNEESLVLRREIGYKPGITIALYNLGLVAYSKGDNSAALAYFEPCLALAREIGQGVLSAYSLLGLGLAALAQTGPDSPSSVQAARLPMLESLSLRQEIGQQYLMTSSLIGLAGAAMQMGEARHAARLLGTVEAALQALGAPVESDVRSLHDQTMAEAQSALGEAAFQAAWAEGKTLTLEQAAAEELAKS